METQNNHEQEQQLSATQEVVDAVKNMPESDKARLGEDIRNKIDALDQEESTQLLKDFDQKNPEAKDGTGPVAEALKDPSNPEKIKAMQNELGYAGGINHYPAEHQAQMKGPDGKMKAPDGKAGPATLQAIENMRNTK